MEGNKYSMEIYDEEDEEIDGFDYFNSDINLL